MINPLQDVVCSSVDYWSDNFDEKQDCEDRAIIDKLIAKKEGKFCSSVSVSKLYFKVLFIFEVSNDELGIPDLSGALRICKNHLSKYLIDTCEYTSVKEAGRLIYCYSRGKR